MHFSIEARLPFLDPRLVEYVASLPTGLKIRDGWTKYVLRLAMQGFVPKEILDRRDKIAFATPQESWFLGELSDYVESILESNLLSSDYLNQAELLKLFQNARHRRKISKEDSDFIWRSIILELWLRKFIPHLRDGSIAS